MFYSTILLLICARWNLNIFSRAVVRSGVCSPMLQIVFSHWRAENSGFRYVFFIWTWKFFLPAGTKTFSARSSRAEKYRAEKPRFCQPQCEKYSSNLGLASRLIFYPSIKCVEYGQLGIGELVLGHIRALKRIPDPIVRTLRTFAGRQKKASCRPRYEITIPSVRDCCPYRFGFSDFLFPVVTL